MTCAAGNRSVYSINMINIFYWDSNCMYSLEAAGPRSAIGRAPDS